MADKPKEIEDFDLEAVEGFELVKIDEGEYEADLTKITKIPNVEVTRNNIKTTMDMLRWMFTTPDGIEITGTSSTKFSPQSKAFKWAQKILDREIETGEKFKPKDLAGRACRIIVKDKTREREFQGQKQTQVYSVVSDVLSPKNKGEAKEEGERKGKKK